MATTQIGFKIFAWIDFSALNWMFDSLTNHFNTAKCDKHGLKHAKTNTRYALWTCKKSKRTWNQIHFWPHSYVEIDLTYIRYLNAQIGISLPFQLTHHKVQHSSTLSTCEWGKQSMQRALSVKRNRGERRRSMDPHRSSQNICAYRLFQV